MGERLGNYDLLGELGRGGMGIVYKGVDSRLGRHVAIKELLILQSLPEVELQDTIERFRREAMAAARMSHPNIVTVYDYGQDGDRHYMAMELLEGRSLGDYLEKKTRFTFQQIADITVQICSALDYAHQAGVVHRDIKPDNIMLSETGVVKLTDFGVARVKSDLPSMTTTGTTLGTIAYISPEQLCDSRLVDGRSDLFSLGAMIYEMLTFRTPFDAGNLGGTIVNIMNAAPPPLRELNPQIPERLEQVVLKALRKNPEERYSRAIEMAHAIQASIRDADRPTTVTITPPQKNVEPCRHCGAALPQGSRVCPSCGRSAMAPLTIRTDTVVNRGGGRQAPNPDGNGIPGAPSPPGIPAMPAAPLPAQGGATGVPRMPPVAPVQRPVNPAIPTMPQTGRPAAQAMAPAPGPQRPPMAQPGSSPVVAPPGTVPGPSNLPHQTLAQRVSVAQPQGTTGSPGMKVTGLKAISSFGRAGIGNLEFRQPRSIVLDGARNLIVADTENGRIQVLDPSGHLVRVIKPNQTQESFRFPRCVGVNSLNILYVTDDLDYRIYKLDSLGRQMAVWKRPRTLEENPAIPGRILISPQGHIALSEPNNHRVLIYDANERLIGTIGREAGLQSPGGLAYDHLGNLIVLDFGSHSVNVFSPRGELLRQFGKRGTSIGEFAVPREVAVDRFDNLFVADTLNHRIQVFSPDGTPLATFGRKGLGFGEFNGPEGMAISPDDKLYVVDRGNARIQVLHIVRT